MSRKLIMIAFIAGFGMVGMTACKSEVDNKPAATVTDPTPPTEETKPTEDPAAAKMPEAPKEEAKAAAPASTTDVNVEASKIEWIGAKVTGDHKGGFKGFTGKAGFDAEGNLMMVSFDVDTKTVYSDAEKLTGHLMSADFFDVEKFPKASFVSTAIVAKAGENMTHEVTGDMELRGVKKTVTFPVNVKVDGDKVVADADFKINRKDFGIVYEGKADDLIKDDVGMTIHLEAPAPKKDG